MTEKSNRLKSILNAIAIALVVPLFILTSQTSSFAVQPHVAAGGLHTVYIKSDGTMVAVGWNEFGQINVGSWTNIVQVAAFDLHTVGVRSDGTVVAVGHNSYGQCDVGSWTDIVKGPLVTLIP
jgi:alpha-tubulin suppressor-like RCC1 family protein